MNTDYPNTEFQRHLAALNACGPARDWVGGRTLQQAWTECQHAGWMAWLATRVLPRKTAVAALVAAIKPEVARCWPAGSAPMVLLVTLRRWTRGRATLKEIRLARTACTAAYADDAAADDDAYASAASAAYADAAAAYAAASASAAYAAARAAASKRMAAILRKNITAAQLARALRSAT